MNKDPGRRGNRAGRVRLCAAVAALALTATGCTAFTSSSSHNAKQGSSAPTTRGIDTGALSICDGGIPDLTLRPNGHFVFNAFEPPCKTAAYKDETLQKPAGSFFSSGDQLAALCLNVVDPPYSVELQDLTNGVTGWAGLGTHQLTTTSFGIPNCVHI